MVMPKELPPRVLTRQDRAKIDKMLGDYVKTVLFHLVSDYRQKKRLPLAADSNDLVAQAAGAEHLAAVDALADRHQGGSAGRHATSRGDSGGSGRAIAYHPDRRSPNSTGIMRTS